MKTILPFKKAVVILLFFLSFFICGCFGINSDFKDIRDNVFTALNTKYVNKEFEYSVSRLGVFLASKIASISDRMLDIEMVLEKISSVQIGVYNLKEEKPLHMDSDSFIRFDEGMKNKGWTRLIINCNQDDKCYVYVNVESRDTIREAFLLNIDSKQLVMIEIHGKLYRLIEELIKKRGITI